MLIRKIKKVFFKVCLYFASDFMLALGKIKIIEADLEEDRKKAYRLRFDIYKRYDYIAARDFEDNMLTDKEDDHSTIFLTLKNNRPVATVRLVSGSKEEEFPIFKIYNVDKKNFSLPLSSACELSKLVMDNLENRWVRFWIWMGLIKRMIRTSKEKKLDYWMFFISEKIDDKINDLFCTETFKITCLPPTDENMDTRKYMINYFRIRNAKPYYLKVGEIGKI